MPATKPDPKVNIGTRIASMFMDHVFMCIVAVVFYMPLMLKGLLSAFDMSDAAPLEPFYMFHGPLFMIGLFGFVLYFCKDCINGRSLAKRILGHQVVRHTTGLAASPLRCMVRNLFDVLWPVEVIIVMVNPPRRLGDLVAGTRVASYDRTAEQPGIKPVQVLLSLLIVYGLALLAVWPMQAATKSGEGAGRGGFVKSSYNEAESRALEKLYTDSLGQYLTATVHVYDSTGKPGIKYISVFCMLKENYLEDDAYGNLLRDKIKHYVYSVFPPRTFNGEANLRYSGRGTMKAYMFSIGNAD